MNTTLSKQTPAVVSAQQCSSQTGLYAAETPSDPPSLSPLGLGIGLYIASKKSIFFFLLGNYHTFHPLAGRNNFRMGNIPFFQLSKGHLILVHSVFLSVPFMRRSWVPSKQMPEHRPLHQHCRKLLGSLALSGTSTASSMHLEEMQTLKF